jgi:hypothetical protein
MISVISTITIVLSASHYISAMIISQGNSNVGTPTATYRQFLQGNSTTSYENVPVILPLVKAYVKRTLTSIVQH